MLSATEAALRSSLFCTYLFLSTSQVDTSGTFLDSLTTKMSSSMSEPNSLLRLSSSWKYSFVSKISSFAKPLFHHRYMYLLTLPCTHYLELFSNNVRLWLIYILHLFLPCTWFLMKTFVPMSIAQGVDFLSCTSRLFSALLELLSAKVQAALSRFLCSVTQSSLLSKSTPNR